MLFITWVYIIRVNCSLPIRPLCLPRVGLVSLERKRKGKKERFQKVVCAKICSLKCCVAHNESNVACDAFSSLRVSWVRVSNGYRPVILGDGGPEDPDHDDRQECEKGFEERAIDLAAGAAADVGADGVVENLAESKEDSRAGEVDHRPRLSQYPQDQYSLKDVECNEEDERHELVENVEGDIAEGSSIAGVPVSSPRVAGVKSDVAGAN